MDICAYLLLTMCIFFFYYDRHAEKMDKSWMQYNRGHPLYIQGIVDFLQFVQQYGGGKEWHKCPCKRCCCGSWETIQGIEKYLSHYGMDPYDTTWTEHGEVLVNDPIMPYFLPNNLHEAGSSSASASPYMDPTLNMLHDAFPYASRYHQEENFDAPQETYSTFSNPNTGDYDKYNRMLEEEQTPVYEGCS